MFTHTRVSDPQVIPNSSSQARTHILTANFGAALLEALLDVLLLIALVVPEPPDEVVERLFKPAQRQREFLFDT